jgi:hypothetical protein
MDRYIRAYFDKSIRANRCQHLIVSDSKHLYIKGDMEEICYQKKDLDHRTCGNRQMVTRVIAIDEDTGIFYAELWPRDERLDLIGFLGRAWAKKKDTPLRGVPAQLLIPKRVSEDEILSCDVRAIAELAGVHLGPAPGGFGPATVACREYERALVNAGAGRRGMVLRATHMGAGLFSAMACHGAIHAFERHWVDVPELPASIYEHLDQEYVESAAWRLGDFEEVIVKPAHA